MVFQTQEYSAQDWVKTRCSLDDSQSTFLTWKGNIYAFVPGEKRKLLFKMLGVSVGRCILHEEASWDFTSRELTYYLHPETEEILHKWENPFTGETVTVMHVANNPVNGYLKANFPLK